MSYTFSSFFHTLSLPFLHQNKSAVAQDSYGGGTNRLWGVGVRDMVSFIGFEWWYTGWKGMVERPEP